MIRAVQARDARKRFREMAPVLNEQSLRRFVAMEARALGRGGVSLMSRISGLVRSTIYHGLADIRDHVSAAKRQIDLVIYGQALSLVAPYRLTQAATV